MAIASAANISVFSQRAEPFGELVETARRDQLLRATGTPEAEPAPDSAPHQLISALAADRTAIHRASSRHPWTVRPCPVFSVRLDVLSPPEHLSFSLSEV
jgi:hypothetical protein